MTLTIILVGPKSRVLWAVKSCPNKNDFI